jgi:hypothetical protein
VFCHQRAGSGPTIGRYAGALYNYCTFIVQSNTCWAMIAVMRQEGVDIVHEYFSRVHGKGRQLVRSRYCDNTPPIIVVGHRYSFIQHLTHHTLSPLSYHVAYLISFYIISPYHISVSYLRIISPIKHSVCNNTELSGNALFIRGYMRSITVPAHIHSCTLKCGLHDFLACQCRIQAQCSPPAMATLKSCLPMSEFSS